MAEDHEAALLPWAGRAAVLLDRHLRVLAATPLARALSPAFAPGVSIARFTFLDSSEVEDLPCWGSAADQVAAMLRDSLDRHRGDREFLTVVGELSARSPRFADSWAAGAEADARGSVVFLDTAVGSVPMDYRLVRDGARLLLLFEAGDATDREALARLAATRQAPAEAASAVPASGAGRSEARTSTAAAAGVPAAAR
ncbi:hypothetical protein GTU71_13600 [Rathayibacter sp. VKM Ac-2762]|uniref:MmyB family transcriptional regulator n=1 Tax=Rathayibacter sp. VKM Ac-2762 TaxID=2609254 RepID=UPI00132EED93|nr:hypothetical protein [Rathayibacter sp. VKM Ac-2762]QHF21769.1 hypothetical protein GTU71_13600 [Rathayibacter sp. VKM Ac-2762]